jgi:hypothetical protein
MKLQRYLLFETFPDSDPTPFKNLIAMSDNFDQIQKFAYEQEQLAYESDPIHTRISGPNYELFDIHTMEFISLSVNMPYDRVDITSAHGDIIFLSRDFEENSL